jgi:hypothetical protein
VRIVSASVSSKADRCAPTSGQRQSEHQTAGAEGSRETERTVDPFHVFLLFSFIAHRGPFPQFADAT